VLLLIFAIDYATPEGDFWARNFLIVPNLHHNPAVPKLGLCNLLKKKIGSGRGDLNSRPPAPKANSKTLRSWSSMSFAHPVSRFMRLFGDIVPKLSQVVANEPFPECFGAAWPWTELEAIVLSTIKEFSVFCAYFRSRASKVCSSSPARSETIQKVIPFWVQ
jgi:hypothetical protein